MIRTRGLKIYEQLNKINLDRYKMIIAQSSIKDARFSREYVKPKVNSKCNKYIGEAPYNPIKYRYYKMQELLRVSSFALSLNETERLLYFVNAIDPEHNMLNTFNDYLDKNNCEDSKEKRQEFCNIYYGFTECYWLISFEQIQEMVFNKNETARVEKVKRKNV